MTGEKKAGGANTTGMKNKAPRPKRASSTEAATTSRASKNATTSAHIMQPEGAVPVSPGRVAKTARTTASHTAGKKKATVALDAEPGKRSKVGRTITAQERWRMISESAYYRAERRGFAGGNPAEDWVAAEAEIDAELVRTDTTVQS